MSVCQLNYLEHDKFIEGQQNFITYIDFHVESGTANMWLYDIFPGIQLMISDFETDSCFRNVNKQNVISINHCHRGRFECVFDKQNLIYMGEGDISINSMNHLPKESSLPLMKFYGSSIIIFPEVANEVMTLAEVGVSIDEIYKKYALETKCHVFRRNEKIEHIYDEIYEHLKAPQLPFLRLKILELLYHFQMEHINLEENVDYLSKALTDKIKHVKEHLIENLSERIYLKEIAQEHGLSLTQLKTYFKEIYGVTPYAYARTYRMNVAAQLLSETEMKIGDIALELSYKNPSKFAEAFLDVIGMSPRDYRLKYRK